MPRRTPVRELQKEEAIPSSPLRRSSRISNSSPVPTKVVSRRNSATETPTPKATRSRRSSLTQDQESEVEVDVDKKAATKTPRTRRGSLTANNEESAKSEEETTAKGKTPDSKKLVTRRRRSTSQDPEPVEEPVKKTRSRNTSAGTSDESVEDKKPKDIPSENGHIEVDQLEVVESKSTSKKKKLDVLKVDLDLSVIKETSFIEDEDKEIEQVQDQEKKSEAVTTIEAESVATVDVEDTKEKTVEETVQAEEKPPIIITTDDNDSVVEKKCIEKEKSSVETKTTENSEDVDDIKEEISTTQVEDAIDETATGEKKSEPVIEETEAAKEDVESTEKQSSEKATTSTKEDDRIEEKIDSPSILKENSSVKEVFDTSFSDSSFHLQLSTSVLDDVNKTGGNLSPTSNKENVQPQQTSEESAPEPMEVDESFADLPSPIKASRKSLNATNMKLNDVEKKLEIAEKATDEIAQFLTEGITSTSELIIKKTPEVPKIVLTISETTEDKETTVDMSMVEYEKPIKEVTDIHLKQSEESVEKKASVVMSAKDSKEESTPERIESQEEASLSESNIPKEKDEESAKLNKTQENLLSEENKPSQDVASQQKEDSETSLENGEKSQVADKDLSRSLNDANTSIQKTAETSFEKTLEKSLPEAEDCKQENSIVEVTVDLEKITETFVISATTEEVGRGNTIQKEEAENAAEPTETLSCSFRDDDLVTAEVQETAVKASVDDTKPQEEISDVAKSQASDVEKKEAEESEEEIVVDIEGDIDGCEEKEDDENVDHEETSTALKGIEEITVSSPVLNKSEVEDHGNSSFVNRSVHAETPAACFVKSVQLSPRTEIGLRYDIYERSGSSREIVIVSDDELLPEDKVEEENQVAPASDEEVEFVREDFEPTVVVKTSPRNENEINIQETLSVEKVNSLNSSKSWVDKTTFVMQETIRAEEDKETSLRDRIHKVVDLFCSEIKNKGDISINVSLECTGQNSDVSDHETSVKHGVNVEAGPGVEERELVQKGSKRRKLYHPENFNAALSMFTDNTPENTTQQISQKKKKIRKIHKKTSEEAQAEEESGKQVATTSKEQETAFKKKIRKQKSSSITESHNKEEIPPPKKKKNKKQKSTIVKESQVEAVSPSKKVKKRKEDAVMGEETEDNQDNIKRVSKKSKRHVDQEILEEKREIIPNKNENVSSEEEAYSSPFARYFSSSFNIDESEDENDVTYQPSRDIDSSDSDLITDESLYAEYTSSEEVEETEESFLYTQKNKTGKTAESKRLSYSSDDNEEVTGSGSEDVFMDEEAEEGMEQDTNKSENSKPKTSKQKKNGQPDVSDEGALQSILTKGKKVKPANAKNSPNNGKTNKKRTYIVSEGDEEFVPERKIKKEKLSPFKLAPKVEAEKVISPKKAKKVPNLKARVGKNAGSKSNKKNFKLKPSTAAADGWKVETV